VHGVGEREGVWQLESRGLLEARLSACAEPT
jgi:hypothetical protein